MWIYLRKIVISLLILITIQQLSVLNIGHCMQIAFNTMVCQLILIHSLHPASQDAHKTVSPNHSQNSSCLSLAKRNWVKLKFILFCFLFTISFTFEVIIMSFSYSPLSFQILPYPLPYSFSNSLAIFPLIFVTFYLS